MSTSPEGSRVSVSDLRTVIATLTREVDLLRRLCSVLEDEQATLVAGDVGRLKANVESQISLVREIAQIEEERRALVGAGGRAGGPPVKLAALMEIAPEEEAASLGSIRDALRDVVEALGRVNTHNSLLIKQSMGYIDKTLKMVAGEDTASAVYTPTGEIKCPTGQIVLNRTI